MKKRGMLSIGLSVALLILSACADGPHETSQTAAEQEKPAVQDMPEVIQGEGVPLHDDENVRVFRYEDIPPYKGEGSVSVNGGIPFFTESDITTDAFEKYSELDELGRCGAAFVNICRELMPTQERGSIGNVRPSGWHTVKYDVIADRYLYNRCHLIGYQLAGENDNERNLITGTRYLNMEGMLPWENKVAEYVEKTGNHVLYRVTPCFEGENLVAYGVLMEAYSVEDHGTGICFNVYCHNVQPGILIDYVTGESGLDEAQTASENQKDQEYNYILNTNTKKFHDPSCDSVQDMKEKNKRYFTGDREEIIGEGYSPCKRCNP